jgi:hypothetical protein
LTVFVFFAVCGRRKNAFWISIVYILGKDDFLDMKVRFGMDRGEEQHHPQAYHGTYENEVSHTLHDFSASS